MCSPGSRLISPLLLFFFLTYLAKGDVFTGRSFIYSLQFKDTYSVNHRHFHFKYPKKREVLFVSNFIILVIFLLCNFNFFGEKQELQTAGLAETPEKKKKKKLLQCQSIRNQEPGFKVPSTAGGQKRLLL